MISRPLLTKIGRDAALRCYRMSTKGAAFISSLGQRPRNFGNAEARALKARFIQAIICVGLTVNRCVAIRRAQALSGSRRELHFQRWFVVRSESWGDAPGWHENAPLALNTHCRSAPSLPS
jgi:hypothetical protein